MSEKLPHSFESSPESPISPLEEREVHKRIIEKGRTAKHEHAENIDKIRAEAEHEAEQAHKTAERYNHPAKPESDQPMLVNRELKQMAYNRTLKRVQSHLPAPSKALSKVIHNPAIEVISDFGAATVARPSGILAGGIAAFLGTSIFLWFAKHNGYEYNFLLFAALFVSGFVIGLIIEMLIKLLRRQKR